MKKLLLIFALTFGFVQSVFAGADLYGTITKIQLKEGGVHFSINVSNIGNVTNKVLADYCNVGWNGMSAYVPTSSPEFPYYYGLIVSANANKNLILLANISVFNGSTACDITKTNYGIVVYPN